MAAWTKFLILVLAGFVVGANAGQQSEIDSKSASHERSKRTMNLDSRFAKWPNNVVPYYYDMTANYYTPAELQTIHDAIQTLQNQLLGGIQFRQVDPMDPLYPHKLKITPYDFAMYPNGFSPNCHTLGGYVVDQSRGNVQPMVLVRGEQAGCLNSVRNVMKFFVIALGRRNEFQRRDRDNYMTVYPDNVANKDTFRIYGLTEDDESTPFDQCSITFEEPTRWALKPGTKAWHFKDTYDFVPTEPILSTLECQTILIWYGRGKLASQCQYFDCFRSRQTGQVIIGTPVAPLPPAPGPVSSPVTSPKPAPAPASTPSPSTTTKPTSTTSTSPAPHILVETTPAPNPLSLPCECTNFCSVAPTESAFMAGPLQFYQTYLLFSGTCVAEYVMDWDKMELQLQTVPASFAIYFGSQGGSLRSPVTLAFMTLDKPDGPTYNAFFQSQMDSKNLQCATSATVSTKGDSCTKAVDSVNVIPTSVATSASPYLYLLNNTVYQYVVDSSSTNIKLMDASFKTTFQTSYGFLDGQSKITRITAIQITMDQIDVHTSVLAVFGIGADSVTPYVGFVEMALNGHPGVPLSPRKWLKEPVALKTGISNCDSLKLRPLTRKVPPPKVAVTPKTSPRPIY